MLDKQKMGYQPKQLTMWSVLTFCATVLAIFIISLLLFPANAASDSFWHRGEFFWYKLVWAEVVFCVAWFLGLHDPYSNLLSQRQQTGGAIPAITSSVINACIFSYGILLLSLFLPEKRIYNIVLLVVQIVVIVITIWRITILNEARFLQQDGIDPIPKNTKQPEELVAQLSILEMNMLKMDADLSWRVKRLREKINYSLPRVGKIATSMRYLSLVNGIEELCTLNESELATASVKQQLGVIEQITLLLITELKM